MSSRDMLPSPDMLPKKRKELEHRLLNDFGRTVRDESSTCFRVNALFALEKKEKKKKSAWWVTFLPNVIFGAVIFK